MEHEAGKGEELVHGEPIGFDTPVSANRHKDAAAALERLERAVRSVCRETGLSEAELSELFDLSVPLPEAPHAAGH